MVIVLHTLNAGPWVADFVTPTSFSSKLRSGDTWDHSPRRVLIANQMYESKRAAKHGPMLGALPKGVIPGRYRD